MQLGINYSQSPICFASRLRRQIRGLLSLYSPTAQLMVHRRVCMRLAAGCSVFAEVAGPDSSAGFGIEIMAARGFLRMK